MRDILDRMAKPKKSAKDVAKHGANRAAGNATAKRPARAFAKKKTARSPAKGAAKSTGKRTGQSAAKNSGKSRAKSEGKSGVKSAGKTSKKPARTAVERLREICLALPEVTEVETWGEPTFRVRTKIFAMHSSASSHHGKGREGVWIAAHTTTQDLVLRAKPDLYFSPPYVGPSGWIGAWLDQRPVWSEITDFLRDAYRMKASKKQIALLGDD
ncbi:MAG: MmcQ/YjbR family DNA-binding protein [Gemmatimonadaceae bacterium]